MIMRRLTGFYTWGEKVTVTRYDLVSHPIIRIRLHRHASSYHVILTYGPVILRVKGKDDALQDF